MNLMHFEVFVTVKVEGMKYHKIKTDLHHYVSWAILCYFNSKLYNFMPINIKTSQEHHYNRCNRHITK